MIDGNLAAVSFGGPNGTIAAAGFVGSQLCGELAVGSHIHHSEIRRRLNSKVTSREWDCLLWAGEGKTDWETSVILGISRSTVTKHIASARDKLGAANKAHAIAQAIRTKLLR